MFALWELCAKVLVFLRLCVRLQKSLGHARFKYDLGSLVTPCGKGHDVLKRERGRQRRRQWEDKRRKSKWKIRVAEGKSERAGKGEKKE